MMLMDLFQRALMRFAGEKYKRHSELSYWRGRKAVEGTLGNAHYVRFFTTHFGLAPAFFSGKRLLDIGCGPRGSLEWADMAAERVGIDPLADEYRKLGAAAHRMRYVACGSEKIPFEDGHFDVVSCFNALDHVENLDRTIAEIARVTARGGTLLLLTEVGHDPTPTEPQVVGWDLAGRFRDAFDVVAERHFEKKAGGMYESLDAAEPYDHEIATKRYGILSCRYARR